MTTTSLFYVEIEFGIDKASDFVRGETLFAQFFNGTPHQILSGTNFFDPITMTLLVQHEGAGPVAEFDDTLSIEFRIGFDHSVWTDHELLRQRPDAW
jgi:hypothetical protein